MAELAGDGFRELAERIDAGTERGDPLGRPAAASKDYIVLELKQSALYRVMFIKEPTDISHYNGPQQAARVPYSGIRAEIVASLGALFMAIPICGSKPGWRPRHSVGNELDCSRDR